MHIKNRIPGRLGWLMSYASRSCELMVFIFQTSSLASYSPQWLRQFQNSAEGGERHQFSLKMSSKSRQTIPFPDNTSFKIIYPARIDVESSEGGIMVRTLRHLHIKKGTHFLYLRSLSQTTTVPSAGSCQPSQDICFLKQGPSSAFSLCIQRRVWMIEISNVGY